MQMFGQVSLISRSVNKASHSSGSSWMPGLTTTSRNTDAKLVQMEHHLARKKTPGLIKRAGIWHIDKQISGRRICQSTGANQLEETEHFLARLTEQARQASVYGVRLTRTFDQAAAKFILENQHKRSIRGDIGRLKLLMPWIGHLALDKIHTGTLQPWIDRGRNQTAAKGTINHGLKVVRRILNLTSTEWVDEHGMTWLLSAPPSNFSAIPINENPNH